VALVILVSHIVPINKLEWIGSHLSTEHVDCSVTAAHWPILYILH